ncbi:MAG: efflux RND transporter periplasmic adaptor subunit [Holophagales bacterium]|nr:efflux RND transporter periplasmic adaptor subunit [Holophagales bacterium]
MRRGRVFLLLSGIAAVALVAFLVARRGERSVVVDLEPAARRAPFRAYVTGSGEIVAARYADIGSSVMGRLVRLAVREGDPVTAGQPLARIDPVPAESEVRAAEAALEALEAEVAAGEAELAEAERDVERVRALGGGGLAARAEVDQAVALADAARARRDASSKRVAEARARLARARDGLSKTEITAPMDGVVTRLVAREGEMVVVGVQNQPGTILMTLSDLSSIDAEAKVAEADVLRLAVGQTATVDIEALAGRELAGRVVEIGASALPPTGVGAAAREFRVVVRLETPEPGLRPGMTCDVRILAEEVADAVTVPLQAVVLRAEGDGPERTGVFRLEEKHARFVPVETGVVGGLEIAVTGLPEGTPVVVGPYAALRDLRDGARLRARAD